MTLIRYTSCLLLSLLGLVLTSQVNASDAPAKPIYSVKVHGEAPRHFDLTNPAQKKEFDELVHSGKAEEVELLKDPSIPKIFSLAWDTGLWALVIFGGLLFVLSKFAWPNIMEGLTKREANIRSALDEAEKAKSDAQRLQSELAIERNKAADQVRGMLEEARKDATAFKEQVKADCQKEVATERDRLRKEIEMAKDQALQELWSKSTELATMISAKTIKREIRPEDHRKLFDEALAEMKAASSARANMGA